MTGKVVDYAERKYRQEFQLHAELAAGNFDPQQLAAAVDAGAADQEQCLLIWNRLEQVRQLSPELHYVYLLYLDGADIRFLADSSSPSCSDFSGPEGLYQEASDELKQIFADGHALVEGPLADRWGEWVSALAPITDPQTGQVIAVLGLDVAAADYLRAIAIYKWSAISISLLFGGLLIVFGIIHKRTTARREHLARLNRELQQEIAARGRIEKQQTEQLMFLQVLIDAIPSPVIYKDDTGRYLGCNRIFEELVMVPRAEIIGKTLEELFVDKLPSEQFNLICKKNRELMERGPNGVMSYDLRLTRSDHKNFHVAVYSANFPNIDGGLAGSVGIYHDISELMELEKALQETETRFRSIFNNAAAGVIVVDTDGHLLQANPAYCQLSGYSELELRQMAYSKLTHKDDLEASKRIYQDAMQRKSERFEIEKRLVKKDGSVIWVQLTGSWVFSADQKTDYAVVLVIDVTEKKRAHEELIEQKDLLDNIIKHVPAAIFWKNRDLTFAGCNQIMADLAGFADPREMIGKTDYDMSWKKEEADFFRECDSKVMESGQPMLNIEEPLLQADGKEAILLTSKVPLTDPAGNVIGLLGIFADISEHKQLQEQREAKHRKDTAKLLHQKTESEGAFRRKSELIAEMSHEIRVPMNSIIGMTELVLEGKLEPEQRECLKMAQQSARSLLTMLSDMLDFSGLETGKLELEQVDFDLGLLLQSVLASARQGAEIKGLRLNGTTDPQLQQLFRGDPVRLKYILQSLLTNAIKYTESGTIDFRAELLDKGEKQSMIQFSVSDPGEGIPAERLPGLFERAGDGSAQSTKPSNGKGLGLVICKRLVELMGGTIQVETEVNRGSCFRAQLLLTNNEKSGTASGNGRHKVSEPQKMNLRVLLAEDNPVNQKLAQRLLEKIGCSVTIVADGQKAIEQLQQETFDLILMDIQMPALNGLDATLRIRAGVAGDACRKLPIFALTAHALAGDRERFLAAGMDVYLSKPLDAKKLYAAIEQFFPPAGKERDVLRRPASGVLDYDSALKRLDNDKELLEEGFDAFLSSAPEQGIRLRNALLVHDFQLVGREAHSIKGAAAMIGAKGLRETSLHLEIAAGERNADKCLLLAPKFEKDLSAVLEWLSIDRAGRAAE